jgi:hypothetical protein
MVQTEPRADGQTVNRGADTCATCPTTTLTETPRPAAPVLQTQIA